jgi:hypothetical protein
MRLITSVSSSVAQYIVFLSKNDRKKQDINDKPAGEREEKISHLSQRMFPISLCFVEPFGSF